MFSSLVRRLLNTGRTKLIVGQYESTTIAKQGWGREKKDSMPIMLNIVHSSSFIFSPWKTFRQFYRQWTTRHNSHSFIPIRPLAIQRSFASCANPVYIYIDSIEINSLSSTGIWPEGADGTDINACCRSTGSEFLVTGDDFGQVNFFRFPVAKLKVTGYHDFTRTAEHPKK